MIGKLLSRMLANAIEGVISNEEPLAATASFDTSGKPALVLDIRVREEVKRVTVTSIIAERVAAEALGLGAPSGFVLETHTAPDRETFEADLSTLKRRKHVTERAIAREEEKQYRESVASAAEFARTSVCFRGALRLRGGSSTRLRLPIRHLTPTESTLSLGFEYRRGLFGVSSAASVPYATDANRERGAIHRREARVATATTKPAKRARRPSRNDS